MEVSIQVPLGPERVSVVGSAERNLKMIREALGVNVTAREGLVHLRGERRAVAVARTVLEQLGSDAGGRGGKSRQQVLELIATEAERQRLGGRGVEDEFRETPGNGEVSSALGVFIAGRPLRAKTPNQERYLDAIRSNDLVFAIGPAGTGKTYLAVAAAVNLLRSDRVKRVILARPAVEAGEKLGYLPGDIQAKVNPYLRPLLDALGDMMDYTTLRRFMESDVVEVVPLAFMRGRTLNNACIILDEAQNTTRGQMQMFLTRMGQGSKMIVTGDVTQIDLPDPRESGLVDAARRLSRVPGVAFATLDRGDVVRHALVQKIVDAYGEEPRKKAAGGRRAKAAGPPSGG